MARPLLLIGDLHLGRQPGRLARVGLDGAALSPIAAWQRAVQFAIDGDVQAVLLAGDVVDQDKDRFEAFGHLQRGVDRLVAHGIAVLGVAGNHDSLALPRLAARIAEFELLGAGGQWQHRALSGIGVVGWSFPTRHHHADPLASPGLREALAAQTAGQPTIGLLHGDLHAQTSPYAPVSARSLADLGLAAWFLGHIHQPSAFSGPSPVGYLGSLVGLDRSETGPRGPWLVTPQADGTVAAEQVPLGPVHWLNLEVDVSAASESPELDDALHTAIEVALAQEAAHNPWIAAGEFSAVGCSIRLAGHVPRPSLVRAFVTGRHAEELVFPMGDVPWVVVDLREITQPTQDLLKLSEERSPVGRLARLIVSLDGGTALPEPIASQLAQFDPSPWLQGGAAPSGRPTERDAAASAALPSDTEAIRAAAVGILDELVAQRLAGEAR
ncbi:MAG: DNA repair exonuclease [Myxococcales bacterium]|nr:DNA repair exonuclease [Myxococcales bacterium]